MLPRLPRPEPDQRSLRMPPVPRDHRRRRGIGGDGGLHFPARARRYQLPDGAFVGPGGEYIHYSNYAALPHNWQAKRMRHCRIESGRIFLLKTVVSTGLPLPNERYCGRAVTVFRATHKPPTTARPDLNLRLAGPRVVGVSASGGRHENGGNHASKTHQDCDHPQAYQPP